MSSASANSGSVVKKYSVDVLLFGELTTKNSNWQYGECSWSKSEDENKSLHEVNSWAGSSRSDYLLLWNNQQDLPEPEILFSIIASGADVAHCGLKQGLGTFLEDLCMLGFSWDKLNAQFEIVSTSWRMGLEACLIRRELFMDIGGLDAVFQSRSAAGLEFGYRSLKLGAIIEYHPEMAEKNLLTDIPKSSAHDFYCLALRHFSLTWARYLFFRRMGRTIKWHDEIRSWRSAHLACMEAPSNWSPEKNSMNISFESLPRNGLHQISVIIPTLGRYDFIPGALKSLLEQTIPVGEVIVVDQNPPSMRQPEIYQGYEKLNLRVIWQDEHGQSLARNTGIISARGEYVFLFDDDSIAHPDLIERHLESLLSGLYDVSTGVSVPSSTSNPDVLPPGYRCPRLSQTFDTGNSLMRVELMRLMGGLDRNFDFGPGTDADFGTRLYLAGYRILHNPRAVRIHFKSPVGGLRIHGAQKYNTDAGLFQPFPPITQSYYALRYLSPFQRRELAFLSFITSKFPQDIRSRGTAMQKIGALLNLLLSMPFYPLKLYRSMVHARKLFDHGPRLFIFGNTK